MDKQTRERKTEAARIKELLGEENDFNFRKEFPPSIVQRMKWRLDRKGTKALES